MANRVKTIDPLSRGDTWTFHLQLRTRTDFPRDDANPTYDPISLFGSVIWFALKISKDDADVDAVLQFQNTPPNDTNSANGIYDFTVPSTVTGIPPRAYYFGFQQVIAGSPDIVKTLGVGKVSVTHDINISTV